MRAACFHAPFKPSWLLSCIFDTHTGTAQRLFLYMLCTHVIDCISTAFTNKNMEDKAIACPLILASEDWPKLLEC